MVHGNYRRSGAKGQVAARQEKVGNGLFPVRVTPKSSTNRVVAATEIAPMKVFVTAVPENGKANVAVIKLLAKHFGIAKSRIEIVHGETARIKMVRINED